ncbi:hypothetical protein [Roseomonas chloroacetimidivorans]|uniref:hypothetical protein n=1 Tax=Roseomonas chloroacetimidivorans TaxID=1766656 RepID=UPI003C74E9FD
MSAGGWPGEPGVPVNAEVEETLHLLGGEPFLWRGDEWWSIEPGNEGYITHSHAASKSYGGPLYTEAQVAARVEEEREATLAILDRLHEAEPQRTADIVERTGGPLGYLRALADVEGAIRARGTRPSQAEGEGRG